jgi:hypothetical protein
MTEGASLYHELWLYEVSRHLQNAVQLKYCYYCTAHYVIMTSQASVTGIPPCGIASHHLQYTQGSLCCSTLPRSLLFPYHCCMLSLHNETAQLGFAQHT